MREEEGEIHSFVVRVWLEQTRQEAGRPVWRGHVTHVSTGERRYLKTLGEIAAFISSCLRSGEAAAGLWSRAKNWLARRRYRTLV